MPPAPTTTDAVPKATVKLLASRPPAPPAPPAAILAPAPPPPPPATTRASTVPSVVPNDDTTKSSLVRNVWIRNPPTSVTVPPVAEIGVNAVHTCVAPK
jgi:hypothetical protein